MLDLSLIYFSVLYSSSVKPKASGNQWKDDILEMSFLKAPIIALLLRLQIKGFIIGVTTVYITDTTALFLEE